MKVAKRYLIFIAVLALMFCGKFYIMTIDASSLNSFRGGELLDEVWNPLVAEDVNSSLLSVFIDNHEFTNESTRLYMDGERNIMVPISILRDSMNCSVHVYDGNTVLIEKHDDSALFTIGETEAVCNGKQRNLSSAPVEKDGEIYISLNDLTEALNYSSTYNPEQVTYVTADSAETTSVIPTSYDLRNRERVSSVRNQLQYGTCWGFAAASALESSLLPEISATFAVDHMVLANSYNVNLYDGGDYTMGMAYFAAWQGPVYEKDDPYGDGETDESLSAAYHVQEMRVIDGKDYEAIKTAVFLYGGVQSSLYSSIRSAYTSDENYNRETTSYCYIGTEKSNHDVVIIGWDDNYPKENFNVELEGDGAFICQNSWGENFGDDGVFYVSYYDTNIGTHNVVYTKVEGTDNYDHIYQSDLCGWVGKIGYNKDSIYGANVFTADGDESIAAASFYATGSNTSYELYVVNDYKNTASFGNARKVASGTLEQAGYYTVDFNQEIAVDEGERYAILLYISTPDSTHPLAIEYDTGDEALANVDLDDGEGYISYNGKTFTDVKEKQNCNLCIKAFTNDR